MLEANTCTPWSWSVGCRSARAVCESDSSSDEHGVDPTATNHGDSDLHWNAAACTSTGQRVIALSPVRFSRTSSREPLGSVRASPKLPCAFERLCDLCCDCSQSARDASNSSQKARAREVHNILRTAGEVHGTKKYNFESGSKPTVDTVHFEADGYRSLQTLEVLKLLLWSLMSLCNGTTMPELLVLGGGDWNSHIGRSTRDDVLSDWCSARRLNTPTSRYGRDTGERIGAGGCSHVVYVTESVAPERYLHQQRGVRAYLMAERMHTTNWRHGRQDGHRRTGPCAFERYVHPNPKDSTDGTSKSHQKWVSYWRTYEYETKIKSWRFLANSSLGRWKKTF